MDASQAVVICTRNRPSEIPETLAAIIEDKSSRELLVVLVDGSDTQEAVQNQAQIGSLEAPSHVSIRYIRYTDKPSAAAQRNEGVRALPDEVEIVHFLDDDATIQPGYFDRISRVLDENRDAAGVGGTVLDAQIQGFTPSWLHKLFLISDDVPGRVLPSGHVTYSHVPWLQPDGDEPFEVEWLSTCACSYRRWVFENYWFDEDYLAAAFIEDRDLSYRISQDHTLLVDPQARVTHRFAQANRPDPAVLNYQRTLDRYRFVRKNKPSLTSEVAFWWSVIGHLAAQAASNHPDKFAAMKGTLQAARMLISNRNLNALPESLQ